MAQVFDLKNITVKYGEFFALDKVSLSLEEGHSLALLGPNGAGKSTLTRILLGQQSPLSGHCKVFSEEPGSLENKARVGVTPQVLDFPKHVTIKEILCFVAAHYETPFETVMDWVRRLNFEKLLLRQSHQMSFGQRRLISIIIAFLGNPKFVILDEPTVGLDVDIRFKIWDIIKEYQNSGGALLITTHHLEEAEELAHTISVLHQGRIIESGSVDSIKTKYGLKMIRFQASQAPKMIDPIQKNGDYFELVSANTDEALRKIVEDKNVKNIEVLPVSLKEAFLNILSEGPRP
ncbi:MAG: ABC transporter ATP-binding protein [Bdellovibrionales bacterium]